MFPDFSVVFSRKTALNYLSAITRRPLHQFILNMGEPTELSPNRAGDPVVSWGSESCSSPPAPQTSLGSSSLWQHRGRAYHQTPPCSAPLGTPGSISRLLLPHPLCRPVRREEARKSKLSSLNRQRRSLPLGFEPVPASPPPTSQHPARRPACAGCAPCPLVG